MKMTEARDEMRNIIQKQEANEKELRRQIETATRKIQNYKDKLTEKQRELNQIREEKRELEQSKNVANSIGTSRDNVEILQKL